MANIKNVSITLLLVTYLFCSSLAQFPLAGFELPEGYTFSPPNTPVLVETALGINSVWGINEILETYNVDCFLHFRWQDPRLAVSANYTATLGGVYESPPKTEVWIPDWLFFNSFGGGFIQNSLSVTQNGTVELAGRASIIMQSRFDYTKYPFETQIFDMYLETFSYTSDNLVWATEDKTNTFYDDSILNLEHIFNARFKFHRLEYHTELVASGTTKGHHRAIYKWTGARLTPFHILNHVMPLVLLTLVAFVAFFLDPTKSAPVKVGSSGIIAVMAFSISIFLALPPVSYLTRMMIYIIISFIFIFVNFALLLAAHKWSRKCAPPKEKEDKVEDVFESKATGGENPLFDNENAKKRVESLETEIPDMVDWSKIGKLFSERGVRLNNAEKAALRGLIQRIMNWYKWIGMSVYLVCTIILFAV